MRLRFHVPPKLPAAPADRGRSVRCVAAALLAGALWGGGPALSAPAASPVASLAPWVVAPSESQVLFDYVRNGNPAEGRFGRFSGEGRFDPAAPGEATLEMRIESGSIDLDDATASAFATSAEWFDSVNHPEVVYRLLRLIPEGGNRYRAAGELTIRGKTLPVATVIELDVADGSARATGSLALDRTDYWLGVGPTALFVDIGREVAVRFELTARRAP